MKRIFLMMGRFYPALALVVILYNSLAVAADGVDSVRDVFGINAPDTSGDIEDKFRERSSQRNLTPREDADLSDLVERSDGPRIIVRKFVFQGLKDYPEYGISKDEVEERAERLRVIYMKEDRIGADGYTPEEKNEITEFLHDIGSQKSVENITHEDLQSLLEIVREQNQSRGLSFADLEEVANKITLYYRSRGLFLARVQLPAQEVKDGIVVLSVMEGKLGQVEVVGKTGYRESVLIAPLKSMMGGVVTSQETEEALYVINDLPGLDVTGGFSAGDNPGETRLKLNITNEDSFDFLVRMDNYGARYTGQTRLYTTMNWYNPTGFGDTLSLGYLRSEDLEGKNEADRESHSDLSQFRYALPLFDMKTSIALSAVYNNYAIVDEDGGLINALDLNGVNSNYSLRVDHKFVRTRAFNISSGIAITDKTSEIKSDLLPSKDHVLGGEMNFYIDGLSESGLRMLNTANFIVQYGSYQTEVDEGQDKEFIKYAIDTSSLFFVPLLFTDRYSRLAINVHIQHSDSPLPSFEQFTMGGATSVRAFQVEDFSADSSVFISNEWYLSLPSWPFWGGQTLADVFQAGLLLDFAYGVQNGGYLESSGSQAGDEWARMSAVGLVFKAAWKDRFSGKISLATPLEAKSSLDPSDNNSSAEPLNDKPDAVEVFADLNFYF